MIVRRKVAVLSYINRFFSVLHKSLCHVSDTMNRWYTSFFCDLLHEFQKKVTYMFPTFLSFDREGREGGGGCIV